MKETESMKEANAGQSALNVGLGSPPIPVAFAAHRFGRWGYIWHTKEDVSGWIEVSNLYLPDPLTHWHGPVALLDVAHNAQVKAAGAASPVSETNEPST